MFAYFENAPQRIAHYTDGYEKGDDKRLIPNGQAAAIHEAFAMRAAHSSHTQIAARLNETAPRPNNGRWIAPMVARILNNRVYLGEAYRGETVNPNAHPPLVSATEWQAAHLAPVRAAARGKRPNLLGGIVRCAGCRYLLAPNKGGVNVPNYRCRGIHTAGVCPEPAYISRGKLENYIEGIWLEQMQAEAITVKHDSQSLQAATDALTAAEEEMTLFASDLTARRVLRGGYHAALKARSAAVNEAQSTLRRALATAPSTELVERYADLPVAERKRILGSSIDAVIVRRGGPGVPVEERVSILWRGEGPDDLPRRGRENGQIRPYTP